MDFAQWSSPDGLCPMVFAQWSLIESDPPLGLMMQPVVTNRADPTAESSAMSGRNITPPG
jgi:hypothetical protein